MYTIILIILFMCMISFLLYLCSLLSFQLLCSRTVGTSYNTLFSSYQIVTEFCTPYFDCPFNVQYSTLCSHLCSVQLTYNSGFSVNSFINFLRNLKLKLYFLEAFHIHIINNNQLSPMGLKILILLLSWYFHTIIHEFLLTFYLFDICFWISNRGHQK